MFTNLLRGTVNLLARLRRERKGAALVEYALLVAGIALISLVAVAILGHKTQNMIGATAVILPGAHADDNGAIMAGRLVETTTDNSGRVLLNVDAIQNGAGKERLGNNLGVNNLGNLVIDTGDLSQQ